MTFTVTNTDEKRNEDRTGNEAIQKSVDIEKGGEKQASCILSSIHCASAQNAQDNADAGQQM